MNWRFAVDGSDPVDPSGRIVFCGDFSDDQKSEMLDWFNQRYGGILGVRQDVPIEPGSPPVQKPRPLRSIPQPVSGPALLSWARSVTNTVGIDLVRLVFEWGEERCILAEVKDWDIGDVTDCLADLAKFLDSRGLLDIPQEARAQMVPVESRVEPQTNLSIPHRPGPLTISNKDPLVNLKNRIVSVLHRVGRIAFGKGLTEAEAMNFLKTRLAEHRLLAVESIRNCTDRGLLHRILSALQEDERDAKHF
jgi:hypothetical protein